MPNFPSAPSKVLLDHIRQSERLMLRAYFDPAGVPTWGYGHIKGVSAADARARRVTTEAQAEIWFEADVHDAEMAVRLNVRVDLTQWQYDALVDFVFNCGANALRTSTLLVVLNAGHPWMVPEQLKRWNKAKDKKTGQLVALPGLTIRRQWEAVLWATPSVAFPPPPAAPYTPTSIPSATVIPSNPAISQTTSLWEMIVRAITAIFTSFRGVPVHA